MTPPSRSQATPGRRDTAVHPGIQLLTLPTDELGSRLTAELVALCGRAFREPFERPWRAVGPGTHVIAMLDAQAVGHALVIERVVAVGLEQPIGLHTAYVENVAAEPRLQGRGIGSAVMRAVNTLVDRYELGALATASNRFYERLGWLTWRGPVYVRRESRHERLSGEDGRVMVRITPRGPATLDLDAPISVEGRAWNAW
jgi:GNAT superfamily N-acetyltransferase